MNQETAIKVLQKLVNNHGDYESLEAMRVITNELLMARNKNVALDNELERVRHEYIDYVISIVKKRINNEKRKPACPKETKSGV
jgi:hypothetical protein